MKLIIIIISLWMERNIGKWQEVRRFDWMNGYFRFMERHLGSFVFWQGLGGVIALLVPPLLVVILVYVLLWMLFFPLAYLFSLALLILMVGPMQLDGQVKSFMRCYQEGDEQAAVYHAQAITEDGYLEHGENLLPAVIQGVLLQASSRYFTVLFWFAVLGPAGTVLSRLLRMVELWSAPHREEGESFESGFYLAAARLREWMEWPVARAVALGYGASGSFVDVMHTIKSLFMADSRELLSQCGFAAMQLKYHRDEQGGLVLDEPPASPEEAVKLVRNARDMVRRTLMFGLAVLALMTLYGLLV